MKCSFVLSVLLLAALTGCRRGPSAPTNNAAPQGVPVATGVAVIRDVPASFDETGGLVADESSNIAPSVAGRVVATPVDAGTFVKKGQVIAELDHRDAELRLRQAQAQLDEATIAVHQAQVRVGLTSKTFDPNNVPEVAAARANYESSQAQAKLAAANAQRYANLVETGDVSRSAFEQARTQQETAEAQANAARQQYEGALNGARQNYQAISSAQSSLDGMHAQVAQAEKAVADTTIRAPFDGFLTSRPVAIGEYVALTNTIATVVSISSLRLQMQAGEQNASRVHLGMTVLANVPAYPGRDFSGVVSVVNASVDPNSRAFLLEARLQNPDAALKPGMFATARVLLPGGERAVFVPQNAVIRDKTTDSYQVWVIQSGKAQLHVVSIGRAEGGSVRILTGLAGGETVATTNQLALYDGAPVQVRSAEKP
jgi:multidrug efflux pump subunit AcrA (membrane-fusion protein)